jgi:type VI protein secretion system component VasK
VDRGSRRAKQLTTFQRDLRISWSNEPNGERNPPPGLLSLAFERHLDRSIERVRTDREKAEQKPREDRKVLGRAMLAEAAAERLKERKRASEWKP